VTVEVLIVNHDTSAFVELAIRSLAATEDCADLGVTVIDNPSRDDGVDALRTAVDGFGFRMIESRWPLDSYGVNTHGDALRDAILVAADAGPGPDWFTGATRY
jgi:GT2 family glycosyltransferase